MCILIKWTLQDGYPSRLHGIFSSLALSLMAPQISLRQSLTYYPTHRGAYLCRLISSLESDKNKASEQVSFPAFDLPSGPLRSQSRKRLHICNLTPSLTSIPAVVLSAPMQKQRGQLIKSESASRGNGGAVSRFLFLNLPFIFATYPLTSGGQPSSVSIFGLAGPGSVPAARRRDHVVGSYPTFSPLPIVVH